MAPQLAKLAKTHGDKVVVLKVNVATHGEMAHKAEVRSIPDTRLYHGGRELGREIGGLGFDRLEQMVLKNAGKLPPVAAVAGVKTLEAKPKTPGLPSGIVAKAPALTPEEAEAKKGQIVPMEEDWLPPGVTRE
jgi:thioredoxin-like negative regulator of GroEL